MQNLLLILLITPTLAIGCNAGEKKCPDEWISNQMPGEVGDSSTREYFIVDGRRVEISDYDIEWVVKNCSLQKEIVY